MEKMHVCIVGGGIIGIACAYYLMKTERFHITLIDKQALGQEASHGNCGLIHHNSHLIPLAYPGIVSKACKMMLSQGKQSTLYIQPSFSFSLWRWLWQFYRNCNDKACERNIVARSILTENSWKLYQMLFKTKAIAYQWHQLGSMKVFQHQEALTREKLLFKPLFDRFGIKCDWLSRDEILALEPTLNVNLVGGCYFPDDAHLQPDLFLKAWVHTLQQSQVMIREQCEMIEIKESAGKAISVKTNQGEIAADYFVFATGAFTPLLKQQLQCQLSIQPGKGYSLSLRPHDHLPTRPIAFTEHNIVYTPMDEYYRLGSILEFVGYNKDLIETRFTQLQNVAKIYLKEASSQQVLEKWCGLRSMTPNGVPYIGPCPRLHNVFVAAGHNMEGMTMAPATAQLITAMLTNTILPFDLTPYKLDRL